MSSKKFYELITPGLTYMMKNVAQAFGQKPNVSRFTPYQKV